MKIENTKKTHLIFAVCSFIFALTVSASAAGPSLVLGKVTGYPDSVVDVPVHFDPGSAAVSGLQFNLTLPADLIVEAVQPSASLKEAGKSVSFNHHGTTWMFLAYGFNQSATKPGIIFTAKIRVPAQRKAATVKLPIDKVLFADARGSTVPAGTQHDGVLVIAAKK
jgi:hypothetical protein